MDRRGLLAGLAGLVLGAAVILLLPSSWLFVSEKGGGGHDHKDGGEDGTRYACPMFCVVLREQPDDGKCPVCGMELGEVSGESRLNPSERRMVGLQVERVRRTGLSREVRVVGEVDYDETRLSRITTRMAGWLEEVSVTTTWVEVGEGDPLASIYSPELYAAQREYLVAWRGAKEDGKDGDPLLSAAGRRLKLLGIGEGEIAKLRETGVVKQALVLRAPRTGVVVEHRAVEGTSVAKGATLYTIADLSRVWIQTEVFERDLPWVRVGQAVRLDVESMPAALEGLISFIDPVIDRRTRTARVRIEVANGKKPDGSRTLRIGQRVDAWIEARVGADGDLVPPTAERWEDALAVPRTAVLRTGERAVVYRLHGLHPNGDPDYALDPARLPDPVFYELVEVRTGPLSRDLRGTARYPIRPGSTLAAGHVIVSKGNLLIDSQAQLSGKPSLLFPEGGTGGGGVDHSGH